MESCGGGTPPAHAHSVEAESPPVTLLYALRSRGAAALGAIVPAGARVGNGDMRGAAPGPGPQHRSPPGFGNDPDPQAAAAAERAASVTLGPIKSRLKVYFATCLGKKVAVLPDGWRVQLQVHLSTGMLYHCRGA